MDAQTYLNDITQNYDKILLLSDGAADFFTGLSEETQKQNRMVLIMKFSELDEMFLNQILDRYYMYSFADNFIVVDDSCPRVATILNYVSTGVLSREEAWRALTEL